MDAAGPLLSHWDNFYVIVGSSAGALTGLQFVVITLLAQQRTSTDMLQIRAFGSPNVVHFCAVLLLSGVLSAPWTALSSVATALLVCGIVGLIYGLTVIRHARRQTGYQPDTEDWLWYAGLPLAAYALLLAGAVLLLSRPAFALFLVAGAALLLLFIGIHNSWDTVTYLVLSRSSNREVGTSTAEQQHAREAEARDDTASPAA